MADCIAEGLWRLDIPLEGNPLKNLNSYLIRGERSLLIDTGFRWASCRLAMERQLEELKLDRDGWIFLQPISQRPGGLGGRNCSAGMPAFHWGD